MKFLGEAGLKKLLDDLKQRLSKKMPTAPQGEVYGASGDSWHVLDDIAKRAVIMISETLSVAETGGIITIQQSDFDKFDEFTVNHNGARAVFLKGSPANTLYNIGENRTLYRFDFNEQARTITITDTKLSDTPTPPTTGTSFLLSKDGDVQWVELPTLLAVNKE